MVLKNYIEDIRKHKEKGQLVHLIDNTYHSFHIRVNKYNRLFKPDYYDFFSIVVNNNEFINELLNMEVVRVEITPRNEMYLYIESIYDLCNKYDVRRI